MNAAERTTAGLAPEPSGPGPDGHATSYRVLVADDNADMREYLQRLLSPGYLVRAVGDGQSALAAARAEHPDLIISDVMMPGMDGLALVMALRRDPATDTIPVLLLSARAGQDATAEGLSAGPDGCLAKPFTAGELRARVRSAVDLSRLRLHESRLRRALIETLEDGFFVYDEQGVFLDVNHVFGEILGYGPEGLPYAPPYPWEPDPVQDPELRLVFDGVTEEALRADSGRYICPVRHPDGRVVWCAITVHSVPDWDGHGRVFIGTVRDVTDERQAADRAPLELTLPAVPTSLAAMRRRLRLWLAAWAVPPVVASQVTLATSEACSNAIEHAYAGDPSGQVRLTARMRGPRLEIVVADGSTWKPAAPADSGRGHGLPMMQTFMDDVVLEPSARGTTVRMSRTVR